MGRQEAVESRCWTTQNNVLKPTYYYYYYYFQNLNSTCLCLPIQSTYVCISQSPVCVWKTPNLVFTCLDVQILILLCLYFTLFNICGCVSKFSAYMFMYFPIRSLYVYIFHVSSFASFICMTHILFFPPIIVHILVIPLHGIYHN